MKKLVLLALALTLTGCKFFEQPASEYSVEFNGVKAYAQSSSNSDNVKLKYTAPNGTVVEFEKVGTDNAPLLDTRAGMFENLVNQLRGLMLP